MKKTVAVTGYQFLKKIVEEFELPDSICYAKIEGRIGGPVTLTVEHIVLDEGSYVRVLKECTLSPDDAKEFDEDASG